MSRVLGPILLVARVLAPHQGERRDRRGPGMLDRRASHLLFPRLDETTAIGTLVSVGAAAGLPLSYVSTGREVSTDIEHTTIRTLVNRALQGDNR